MMTKNSKVHKFFTVEYKGTIYFRFDKYGPEYTVWMKVDKADQVNNVEVYNFLETAYKKTDLDIIKECRQTGRTRTTTKKLLEKGYYEQMTNEIDISKVLIEGDTATIMGVKYKKVEEPKKPETLYDIIADWWDDVFAKEGDEGDLPVIEDIVDRIETWLPKEQSAAGSQNVYVECTVEGFNDCLNKIKRKLR